MRPDDSVIPQCIGLNGPNGFITMALRFWSEETKGIALITSLLFLAILSLCWLTLLWLAGQEAENVQNQIGVDQSAYVAESGMQQALWRLSQDHNWTTWGTTLPSSSWIGSHGSDSEGFYYAWEGTIGDPAQPYSVRIRNNGTIRTKIVSLGMSPFSSRTIVQEIGSAFDFGLFSQSRLQFGGGTLTVSGTANHGYVYAKDGVTDPAGLLRANKIATNCAGGPASYYFFPKALPFPKLWKTKDLLTGSPAGMEASISGPPSATALSYNRESGEEYLEGGALLHNRTKGNFRTITAFDAGGNTITTKTSPDNWESGDSMVIERISLYENFWQILAGNLDLLKDPSLYGTADARIFVYPDPDILEQSYSNFHFTHTPTVQFGGNTTFSGNVAIDGNAIFGRLHSVLDINGNPIAFGGETIISGNVVICGNAYFLNRISITSTGHLYVVGSAYLWDMPSYNWTCYGCDMGGGDIIINESSSGNHGITITADAGLSGGLMVRDGSLTIYKSVPEGDLAIEGYCYANQDSVICYGTPAWRGRVRIRNNDAVNSAFYVRNGALEIGSGTNPILSDLEGKGRIIAARNINLTHDLLVSTVSGSAVPAFIAAGGDFALGNNVGSPGAPFCGVVYAGEKLSVGGSIYVGGGMIIANDCSTPLKGGSITYREFTGQLYEFGFTDNKDYARPLLWSE